MQLIVYLYNVISVKLKEILTNIKNVLNLFLTFELPILYIINSVMNIKIINQQYLYLKIRLKPGLNYVTGTFLIEHY